MSDFQGDVMKMAVMWYGIGILPWLRRMPRAQRLAAMKEADAHNNVEPLWMHPKADLAVPSLGDHYETKLLTGCQVIAVMVFGLWVECGENEEMACGLWDSWGDCIKTAMALCEEIQCHVQNTVSREQSAAAGAVR